MMNAPDILKVRNPRDLKFTVDYHDMCRAYEIIRRSMDDTRLCEDGSIHYNYESCQLDTRYYTILGNDVASWAGVKYGPRIRLHINYQKKEDGGYGSMFSMTVLTTNEVGIKVPTEVIWSIDKAVVENVDGDHDNVRIILKDHERNVATLTMSHKRDFRHRQGEFVFDGSNLKKERRDIGGGCRMCDHAVYEKENGIIYFKCTKYDGRVAEMEYTGEEYPTYCKRRR